MIVGADVARAQAQSSAERLHCLVDPPLLFVGQTQIEVGLGVVGI